MFSIDGEHVQGNALGEYMDGVVNPSVELVVVTLALQDQVIDGNAVLVLVGVELERWGDRCHFGFLLTWLVKG